MKPPPPIPHDAGLVTPTASAVATAASIALPPRFRISTPAAAASALSETTIPCAPTADRSRAAPAAKDGGATENEIAIAMDMTSARRCFAETLPPPETNITGFTNSHRQRMKAGVTPALNVQAGSGRGDPCTQCP